MRRALTVLVMVLVWSFSSTGSAYAANLGNSNTSNGPFLVTDNWFADGRASSTQNPPGNYQRVNPGEYSRRHYYDADAFYVYRNCVGTIHTSHRHVGPKWVKVSGDIYYNIKIQCSGQRYY